MDLYGDDAFNNDPTSAGNTELLAIIERMDRKLHKLNKKLKKSKKHKRKHHEDVWWHKTVEKSVPEAFGFATALINNSRGK